MRVRALHEQREQPFLGARRQRPRQVEAFERDLGGPVDEPEDVHVKGISMPRISSPELNRQPKLPLVPGAGGEPAATETGATVTRPIFCLLSISSK